MKHKTNHKTKPEPELKFGIEPVPGSGTSEKKKKEPKTNNGKPYVEHSKVLYVVLVVLFLLANYYTRKVSSSDSALQLFDSTILLKSFSGVFSSIASICCILLAVYLGKMGFFTSLILCLVQFPIILVGMIRAHNLNGIPGLFTNVLTITAIVVIYRRNKKIDNYQKIEMDQLKEQEKGSRRLFEQTITSLVSAIDAKDEYSRGHSVRVAEYSKKIAETMGKSEDECARIYYAGLLHDVGKIGIADGILTKNGKLTDDEYKEIKKHPGIGKEILSGIREYPFLSVGAHYHHERYDGKGYPEGRKGEDIPEIARIMAVSDAYDAMTSNRSYRNAMPQQIVREEIVKGSGSQFDPKIAEVMQHLIDVDEEYVMKEREEIKELAGKNELVCTDYRKEISDGIRITSTITKLRLKTDPTEQGDTAKYLPTLILFDAEDGNVHTGEKLIRAMHYFEYAEVRFDGDTKISGARTSRVDISDVEMRRTSILKKIRDNVYDVEMVKYKDHVMITMDNGLRKVQVIVALPDSSRYVYAGITGEHCRISDVSVKKQEVTVEEDYIPRIAPEISYIDGPEGDIPNVQVDGYRTAATEGIPIRGKMEIRFHTMSLPTAHLIWHCPYIDIFRSADGKVDGEGYAEHALVRLDGEYWAPDGSIRNQMQVTRRDDFLGWEGWKEKNKQGYECVVTFDRRDEEVTMITENLGIRIRNITYIDKHKDLYIALTGDQCALTDIRIVHFDE